MEFDSELTLAQKIARRTQQYPTFVGASMGMRTPSPTFA